MSEIPAAKELGRLTWGLLVLHLQGDEKQVGPQASIQEVHFLFLGGGGLQMEKLSPRDHDQRKGILLSLTKERGQKPFPRDTPCGQSGRKAKGNL